jgi:antitoxin (DNA-binding transcriptional repressor) of toxin-antitoxin stability system
VVSKSRFDDELGQQPSGDRTRHRRSVAARRDVAAFDPALVFSEVRGDRAAQVTSRRSGDAARNPRAERAVKRRLEGAGFRVEFRDDDLFVDGVPVGNDTRLRLARYRERVDWARDDAAFARLVETVLADILLRQVRKHAGAWDASAIVEAVEHGHGLVIRRRGLVVARITAARFVAADGRTHGGTYWASGKHWDTALALLPPGVPRPEPPRRERPARVVVKEGAARAPRNRPTPTPTPAVPHPVLPNRLVLQRRIDLEPGRWEVWPDDASPELTVIAVSASAPLRGARVRIDEDDIEVSCSDGWLVQLSPVRRRKRSGILELPFEIRKAAGMLQGSVDLGSPAAPLAIHVAFRDDAVPLPDAWALVLELAEARYCADPHLSAREEPSGFVPDGPTRELRKHWVRAHRMRLSEGCTADDDAVKAAEEVGIDLPEGFTWRSGHYRGVSEPGLKRVLRYTFHRAARDRVES